VPFLEYFEAPAAKRVEGVTDLRPPQRRAVFKCSSR
jgi:hypothetical protein